MLHSFTDASGWNRIPVFSQQLADCRHREEPTRVKFTDWDDWSSSNCKYYSHTHQRFFETCDRTCANAIEVMPVSGQDHVKASTFISLALISLELSTTLKASPVTILPMVFHFFLSSHLRQENSYLSPLLLLIIYSYSLFSCSMFFWLRKSSRLDTSRHVCLSLPSFIFFFFFSFGNHQKRSSICKFSVKIRI